MPQPTSHQPRAVPQIMVSSTFTDLQKHRAALMEAIHGHKLHANVMENDSARLVDVIESSLQMVRDSAAYIGVIGLKYGQTPEDPQRNPGTLSITELEFNEAQRLERPILLFIMSEDHLVKRADIEIDPAKQEKLNAFRNRAKRASPGSSVHRVYAIFSSVEEFTAKLGSSLAELSRHLESNDREPSTESPVGWRPWIERQARKLVSDFAAQLRRKDHWDAAQHYIDLHVRVGDPADSGQALVPLASLVDRPGTTILLLGEGGCGKSTMLAKLAVERMQAAASGAETPLPILVKLNFFDASEKAFDALLEIVARAAEFDKAVMYELWNEGRRPLLFLFDGINEVRPEFADNCRSALVQFAQRDAHAYVITSRPPRENREFVKQLRQGRIAHVVGPNETQIRRFLEVYGRGTMYDKLQKPLQALGTTPFMLWAIATSHRAGDVGGVGSNLGELYRRLIDEDLLQGYEREKPQEARPTQYEYLRVKKPVLARLACDMCRHGLTRRRIDGPTRAGVRQHLLQIRTLLTDEEALSLTPHVTMPDPPDAQALLDESAQNGLLRRSADTIEFMHESVRDYFAATAMQTWPLDHILAVVPTWHWRHVDPDRDFDGHAVLFDQAMIMLSGLMPDSSDLVTALAPRRPWLAARCLAAARAVRRDTRNRLKEEWLALVEKPASRYRWIGSECLAAAFARDVSVVRRLAELAATSDERAVISAVVQVLNRTHDEDAIRVLVDRALERWSISLGTGFYRLRSANAVRLLVDAWRDPKQPVERRQYAQRLLASMDRAIVTGTIRDLMNDAAGDPDLGKACELALNEIETWQEVNDVIPIGLWLRRGDAAKADRGEAERAAMELMTGWPAERLLDSLRDERPAIRLVAARLLPREMGNAVPHLLDAIGREDDQRVRPELLRSVSDIGDRDTLWREWARRTSDPYLPLLFEFPSGSLDEEELRAEFGRHGLSWPARTRVTKTSSAWAIESLNEFDVGVGPAYEATSTNGFIRVVDPERRSRLVDVARIIGAPAISVLASVIDDDLRSPSPFRLRPPAREIAADVLGQIGTSDAIPPLARLLTVPRSRKDAVVALGRTRSPEAAAPLLNLLASIRPMKTDESLPMGDPGNETRDLELLLGDWPSPHDGLVAMIVRSLEQIAAGGQLLDFARDALRDSSDHQIVAACALAAWDGKDSGFEDVLYRLLGSGEPRVRVWAIKGIVGVPSDRAEAELVRRCLDDPALEVRAEAAEALRRGDSERPLQQLLDTLATGTVESRIRSAEALGGMQDPAATDGLSKALRDTVTEVQVAAAHAIVAIGHEGVDAAFDRLATLARKDQREPIRMAALSVLTNSARGREALYQPVTRALAEHRWQDVLDEIGRDEPFNPRDARLLRWRGLALWRSNQVELALADLTRACELVPSDAEAHGMRAQLLEQLGRPGDAVDAVRRAIVLQPDNAAAHGVLGWYAYKAGLWAESISASRRALELDGQLEDVAFNLGLAYLANGDQEQAAGAYRMAVALSDASGPERQRAGRTAAAGDLRELIVTSPQNATAALELIAFIENGA